MSNERPTTRPFTGTCRLQLHKEFPLARAAALVPYLERLGVSHVYASPILAARPGSTHGYDVADFARVNPELGGDEARGALVDALRARGMGLLLDIVPNHMGIGPSNPYWEDVLAHGRASRWAHLFDVDWSPPQRRLRGKVLLPVLGDELEAVMARGELAVRQEGDAPPRLAYFDNTYPLAPETHAFVTHFGPQQPDELRPLLAAQHYVLEFWKKGAREVNYRRFFDVNELAALRAEDPATFDATHALPLAWVEAGELDGLRIDHVDGLLDPVAYLERLRGEVHRRAGDRARAFPVFVEKILSPGEHLRRAWPVDGTTGYEFMNDLEAVFIDPAGDREIEQGYRALLKLRDGAAEFAEVAIRGKIQILRGPLRPDVDRLVTRLVPIAARDDRARELGRRELFEAVLQLLAALPVYRTYVARPDAVDAEDVALVERALARALQRHAIPEERLRFVADVLLLRDPGTTTDAERAERLEFVRRFQQVSGPATAKGIEDTALYLYFPLSSRNEVGGEPDRDLSDAVGAFHRGAEERAADWPRAILSTNTHDTKRSADVRARLDVLSELPGEWLAAVARWRRLLAPRRTRVGSRTFPDANAEYLVFQTLVGTWPLEWGAAVPAADALTALADRVHQYMLKATREGKTMTSWTEPDQAYEQALEAYVRGALDPARSGAFLREVAGFVGRVARPGLWNALSRVALHFTAPGTPDLYQGDELWAFALVDPDNRRPVDWDRRERVLAEVEAAGGDEEARTRLLADALATPEDGRIKLLLTRALLHARRADPGLFERGSWRAVPVQGALARHVVAGLREHEGRAALVVAPRLTLGVSRDGAAPVGDRWGDAALRASDLLVRQEWRCALTGRRRSGGGDSPLPLSVLLADAPVGVWLAGG